MKKYNIVVYLPFTELKVLQSLTENFIVTETDSIDSCLQLVSGNEYQALVVDLLAGGTADFSLCEALLKEEVMEELPLLVFSACNELRYKLKAFELGCDDYIESDITPEEACARINKAIYNRIANAQLKSRLNLANQTAHAVMSDNSDLGSNIRFLLEVNRCDNLDQLGLLFFSTIERYGLSSSLQMRSVHQIKNMDANGLARDLESQLLDQMKAAGRYIDFGRRTIMNYGQVSLLVRNMPVDDEKRYGAVKDNTFALIQGVDARVKALDSRQKLVDEKKSLFRLSSEVREVMQELDDSYQAVMCDIVGAVEDMAEAIQNRIPSLVLSEEQEKFFEQVTYECVLNTNRIFNQGLKVDECFQKLSQSMELALSQSAEIEELPSDNEDQSDSPNAGSLELF